MDERLTETSARGPDAPHDASAPGPPPPLASPTGPGPSAPEDAAQVPNAPATAPPAKRPRKARKKKPKLGRCALSGALVPKRDLYPVAALRPAIGDRLRAEYPDLEPEALVSRRLLDELRSRYIGDILSDERGQLSLLEERVVHSLERHETVAENIEQTFDTKRTFGEKVSDHLAKFGGSWAFLISFGGILLVWMAYNAVAADGLVFDPFPFILLNLLLSCLAAIQAPIIMMSQKRTEAKDRMRAISEYQVNLKAELEIRHLHEKMDHILKSQWERLAEMQEIQLDLLQELDRRSARRK